MTLETLISLSRSGSEPWNSGGYSIEPTPMIAPWPCIRRGTEWFVPMVPGLVKVMVVPAKSSRVSELALAFLTISSYAVQNWAKSSRSQRSEEHTSELQSRQYLVCRLLLEKKK